jgi:deoxyribodipyrimidine photo-lyase
MHISSGDRVTVADLAVPEIRITATNARPARADGELVLYWMIAARRTRSSFALQRAAGWAERLGRPLVVLEALRCDYQWASDRLHAFVLAGMADNAAAFAATAATYYPYVETDRGAGKGLLEALGGRACVVVTDDYPCFFLPRIVAAAAARLPVLVEAVDGNGLLPLRAAERVFPTAFAFRSYLQDELPRHLCKFPAENPLADVTLPRLRALPEEIVRRWPPLDLRSAGSALVHRLPLDHEVAPVAGAGGSRAGAAALRRFVDERLAAYAARRNDVVDEVASGLSPYLHFGHVGAHQVFAEVAAREGWTLDHLAGRAGGRRAGWWHLSEGAEAFLDQLVTWRELGFNMAHLRDDHDRYEALPPWARLTLERHAADPRPVVYTLDRLADADTHDPLWNAAQVQLRREGRIHNYLRMLWGKKILEWSATPQEAAAAMIALNDRWALDGRDPNSYSGIYWTLGRYDRPWGPERPIFGTVRYMSSANTARKLNVRPYLAAYAAARHLLPFD